MEIYAKKNNKVEQLIMVGTKNINQMYPLIRDQDNHDGDADQHQWINNLDGVLYCISDDPEKAAKQAVIVWMGEEYLDTKQTFTCADGKATSGNSVDLDGDGKPSDKIDDNVTVSIDADADGRPSAVIQASAAVYNAVSMARAICGYDYEVEFWEPMTDGAGNPIWDIEPTTDPVTGITTDGVQRQKLSVKQEHAKGYAELWAEKGAKVYIAGLGPVSKEKGNGSNGVLDVVGDVPANVKTLEFNKALSANTAGYNFLDVYDIILDHVPYYADGSAGGENSDYDENTLQWIFHMLWNTVLQDNPMEEPPEPIDVSLYSVSCSLTTYMNNVLGPNADESHDDHKLAESTTDPGDAGGFLGFGDSNYGFASFITGQFSKTSSVVDYSALLDVEPGSSSNMYYYGQYGRLLSDMGLDQTSTELVGIGPRAIPGALALLFYVISSGLNLGFSEMMNLLRLLNPFQFFANTTAIGSEIRKELSAGGAFKKLGVGGSLVTYIGEAYGIFRDMGVMVILPMGLFILIVSYLFRKKPDKNYPMGKKIWTFVLRTFFISVGVPLLGCLYTACLENVCDIISTTDCASTEMVASTFVNFGEWAKQYRLSPRVGGVYEAESFGDAVGQASEKSYKYLRNTVYQINKATGVADEIDMSGIGVDSLSDVNAWNQNVMSVKDGSGWDGTIDKFTDKYESDVTAMKQALGLLVPWSRGSFYHSSDFESDTMSVFSDKHKDDLTSKGESLIGRRPGTDETDPPDNSETLYELFENTSTAEAWAGRDKDANVRIFENRTNKEEDFKWKKFNIFANGSLKATKSGDVIKYTDPDAQQCNKTGTGSCLSATMGLSTVAMYNYLSTDFQKNQMVIYSQAEAASMHTSKSHFSVNLIGSGIWNMMYYLNMLAVMIVVSIIGIYYILGMVWNNVKQSMTLLLAIPGAMLGVLRSIVNVIVIILMMMAEIIGTIIIYEVISDLVGVMATILDGGFYDKFDVEAAASMIGGLFAESGSGFVAVPYMMSLFLCFVVFLVFVVCVSVFAIKYHKAFLRCHAKLSELLLVFMVRDAVVWELYYERKERKNDDCRSHIFACAYSLVMIKA